MLREFNAEGINFSLKNNHFIIESSAGTIFEATRGTDKFWRTSENLAYSSFAAVWADLRPYISEIASSIWTEENYEEFYNAVNALFSTPVIER